MMIHPSKLKPFWSSLIAGCCIIFFPLIPCIVVVTSPICCSCWSLIIFYWIMVLWCPIPWIWMTVPYFSLVMFILIFFYSLKYFMVMRVSIWFIFNFFPSFCKPISSVLFLETMAPSIHCASFSYLNNLTFFISNLLVELFSCTNLKIFIESPSSSSPLNLGIVISSNLGSNQTPQITTLISYKLWYQLVILSFFNIFSYVSSFQKLLNHLNRKSQ